MSKMKDLWNILTRSELWVTVFVVISAVYEAGMLPDNWSRIAALMIAALTALGYGTARTIKKVKEAQSAAVIAASNAVAANPTPAP